MENKMVKSVGEEKVSKNNEISYFEKKSDEPQVNAKSKVLTELFIAWLRNKLVPVCFMLQKPALGRSEQRVKNAIKTVYELCGHYCYDDDYEHYFFHLISILERMPNVTREECDLGLKDIEIISRFLNFGFVEEK